MASQHPCRKWPTLCFEQRPPTDLPAVSKASRPSSMAIIKGYADDGRSDDRLWTVSTAIFVCGALEEHPPYIRGPKLASNRERQMPPPGRKLRFVHVVWI
jgi:hypothetical protein